MFPVSVCLGIESKRFAEEETQRKRLGSLQDEFAWQTCHFSGGATEMVAGHAAVLFVKSVTSQ
jgi:hypothetical protein